MQDSIDRAEVPTSHVDDLDSQQDGALRLLVQQAVVARFKRICGLEIVTGIRTIDSRLGACAWPEGDHPLCRDCQREGTCRRDCARLLRRTESTRAARQRCPRGNWWKVLPLIGRGGDLIVCKLVCPPAVSKHAFESGVELLAVLRENLAIRAIAVRGRGARSPGMQGSLPRATFDVDDGKSINPLVQCARNLIDRHWRDPDLSVSGIARALGVNPNYLAHVFSRAFGEHMRLYITRLRVERAKVMLIEKRWQIKRIAYECGFARPNWFSEAFRRHTGLSPSGYRRHSR